jgi:hypothetical protein
MQAGISTIEKRRVDRKVTTYHDDDSIDKIGPSTYYNIPIRLATRAEAYVNDSSL